MSTFEQIYTPEDRQALVKRYTKKIKAALTDVPKATLDLHAPLIADAAMYMATVDECNALIERDGFVEAYQHGANQSGFKRTVAAEMKPQYTKSLQSLLKQLTALLPSESDKDAAAELMDYLNSK